MSFIIFFRRSAVKEEMVAEKGLPEAVADKIGEMVQLRGQPFELLARLQADPLFSKFIAARAL